MVPGQGKEGKMAESALAFFVGAGVDHDFAFFDLANYKFEIAEAVRLDHWSRAEKQLTPARLDDSGQFEPATEAVDQFVVFKISDHVGPAPVAKGVWFAGDFVNRIW
jgi:hypothetical protein